MGSLFLEVYSKSELGTNAPHHLLHL